MQLGAFYDLNGDQNTGNYTFNISTKAPAVPEASTTLSFGAMLLLGAGGWSLRPVSGMSPGSNFA